MKIIIITLALLTISLQVRAVNLSSDGTGQVLIFPYYTVNQGFNTLINLSNTTDEAKALRVRFRESANSREVFAFNLYLGPNDVWTGVLVHQSDDVQNAAMIISYDLSCTNPIIANNVFNNSQYTGTLLDRYGASDNRLREGFIEVIEMGVLTGDSAHATIIEAESSAPVDCAKLRNAWDESSNNSYWITDATTDILAPSGGITGNIVLINVNDGIAIGEEPTAINDFSDQVLNFDVTSGSPNLSEGKSSATVFDGSGNAIKTEWDSGVKALSAILTKSTIHNEYALFDGIGALTDWIVTMPTRQYYIDPLYTGVPLPLNPFSAPYQILQCELFDLTYLDRESQRPNNTPCRPHPCPSRRLKPALCYSVTNVNFNNHYNFDSPRVVVSGQFNSNFQLSDINNNNADASIISGDLVYRASTMDYFDAGWATFRFNQSTYSVSNHTLVGLPLIGFSVQSFSNGTLIDEAGNYTLANYAAIFKHSHTTAIESNKSGNDDANIISGMKLSGDDVGQVLIYPYYSVRNDLNTLITVINTTGETKALKVRFLEGKNNRECLGLNLYLSPYDVWTAALSASESSVPNHEGEESTRLEWHDSSCIIVPSNTYGEFLPHSFTGENSDVYSADLARCTEGHIEIYEMGRLTGGSEIAADSLYKDCDLLANNWLAGGIWDVNPETDMMPSSTRASIMGSAHIIDVSSGADMTYDATAIVGYSSVNQHTNITEKHPNLASGDNSTTLIETNEGVIQTTWDSPLDAVTALFMQYEVFNDFVINPVIGAQTDWVNLYPTKQYYVDPLYNGNEVSAPFDAELGNREQFYFNYFNREQLDSLYDVSEDLPGMPANLFGSIYSLNVLSLSTLNAQNHVGIFASNLQPNNKALQLRFFEGRMSITAATTFYENQANDYLTGIGANGETHKIYGKPILGFVAQKYINGVLRIDENQILANYAIINKNKSARKIEVIPKSQY
ncbi:MAG: hypothetical protein L3J53_07680 [Proteobacteria bacterium]|nr:hypothetical protein [Pseudomonadota bacterium]